ncbi:MAG: pyruvate dehydrogenase [Bacteroidetes bacterium]|nr:MAG: pyruvate dehydrogenase [Bacteroidota bacterium]
MAEIIKMPRLSDTMTEGVIAAWHKNIGDTVKKGDLLAEIETDKATMELESYRDGVLLHLGAAPGGKLQVDDLLVIVGVPGEDISALLAAPSNGTATAVVATDAAAQAAPLSPAPVAQAAPALDLTTISEVVLMPRLSDTMTEGVIAGWQKNVGDAVKKGDVLADIETDKATMELESYKDGVLLYQGANAGQKIMVNDLLAIIGAVDFKIDGIIAASKATVPPSGAAAPASTAAATLAPTVETPVPVAAVAAPVVVNTGRIFASPLAKKLASEKGIDLRFVPGTGDNGRITKIDIDNYKAPSPAALPVTAMAAEITAPAAAPIAAAQPSTAGAVAPFVPAIGGAEGHTDVPNSQMRKVIAKRLGESLFTAPHFYLKMEINMDAAMEARTQMNVVSPVKISFNDLVIKASAMALIKHPAVNSSWMGDFIRTYSHVHIGMAVAVPDGLIVPVIRFANQKSLSQISAEAKELGGKAKAKKLQPNEFSGNTFTISNLGMMDIDEFTAIINPPDSCILAVGRIKEEVYRNANGEFAVKNVMKLTLSCDHRSVDGAVGAAFLQTVKAYLENPVTMLV